jgi:hypothetical protein
MHLAALAALAQEPFPLAGLVEIFQAILSFFKHEAFLVAGILAVLFILVPILIVRQRRRLQRILPEAAQRFGFAMSEPSGIPGQPRRWRPILTGRYRGHDARFFTFETTIGQGKSSDSVTLDLHAVEVTVSGVNKFAFEAYARNTPPPSPESDWAEIVADDAAFDKVFVVRANAREPARALFDRKTRDWLVAKNGHGGFHIRLSLREGRLRYAEAMGFVRGVDTMAAMLDFACGLVERMEANRA